MTSGSGPRTTHEDLLDLVHDAIAEYTAECSDLSGLVRDLESLIGELEITAITPAGWAEELRGAWTALALIWEEARYRGEWFVPADVTREALGRLKDLTATGASATL